MTTELDTVDDGAADDQKAFAAATRSQVRREQRGVLFRSPGFLIGAFIVGFWILSSIWPDLLATWEPKHRW